MRFPARAGRFPADRQVQAHRRPAPDPAGEKRPPGVGRALAGGFGPPAGQVSRVGSGRGDGPCHGNGAVPPPLRAGPGNALRFPRPRGTVPRRSAGPGTPQASARRGRGGRWPGALGPRLAWDQRSAVAGAMAPATATTQFRRRFGREQETHAFPRPCGTVPHRPAGPGITQASARPGGREAPAEGGAGAGRGLWAPGWPGISRALWQGRWPLPWRRGWWFGL
jgi:hypothetical protein